MGKAQNFLTAPRISSIKRIKLVARFAWLLLFRLFEAHTRRRAPPLCQWNTSTPANPTPAVTCTVGNTEDTKS